MQCRPWHLNKEVVTGRFAGNRCGRRRRVQGQGGWCGGFRCKKRVARDKVAGAGPPLKVHLKWPWLSFILEHVAGWQSSELHFQPGAPGCTEDSLLEHISAELVLQGGKIWFWAKAKEWSKDSWVLFLIPTQV